jgi:hypothetical protein
LNNYGSHAIFRFKILANNYKIIILYLPAHTTHRLQLLDIGIFSFQSGFYFNEVVQYFRWIGYSISKREYLDWIITARKKTNTKFNILSIWKKIGLISFNFDLVFGKLPTIKKYISESQISLIEISIISVKLSFQITVLIIGFLSRPVTPADQVTIINEIIIMRFPIGNSLII